MSSLRRRLEVVAPPVVLGVLLVLGWEWFVTWRHIKPLILPTPSAIWSAALDNLTPLWEGTKVSGVNAFVGLAVGVLFGALLAAVTNRFRAVNELIAPIAVAVNAVPIVVMVSIFSRMFEQTSEVPRRLMVSLVVFFVIFVNVSRGLRQSSPTQLELMRSYAATGRQQFWKVRLPNASPFLFNGIRIAAPLSVITAFVAEYFGGLQNGLGSRIASAMSNSKRELGWAYVGAACVLGLTFFIVATILEHVAVPWQRQRRSG